MTDDQARLDAEVLVEHLATGTSFSHQTARELLVESGRCRRLSWARLRRAVEAAGGAQRSACYFVIPPPSAAAESPAPHVSRQELPAAVAVSAPSTPSVAAPPRARPEPETGGVPYPYDPTWGKGGMPNLYFRDDAGRLWWVAVSTATRTNVGRVVPDGLVDYTGLTPDTWPTHTAGWVSADRPMPHPWDARRAPSDLAS